MGAICWMWGVVGAGLSFVLPSGAALGDVVIDTFETPIQAATSGLAGSYPLVVGHGVRHGRGINLLFLSNDEPAGAVDVEVQPVNGIPCLTYSSTNEASGNFEVEYGTSMALRPVSFPTIGMLTGTEPSPLNLTVDSSSDFFRLSFLDFTSPSSSGMTVDVHLGIGLPPYDYSSAEISGSISAEGPQTLDIPVGAIPADSLSSVDFQFEAPAGSAFQISSISLVTPTPEPGTLWIYSFVFSRLVTRSKRR